MFEVMCTCSAANVSYSETQFRSHSGIKNLWIADLLLVRACYLLLLFQRVADHGSLKWVVKPRQGKPSSVIHTYHEDRGGSYSCSKHRKLLWVCDECVFFGGGVPSAPLDHVLIVLTIFRCSEEPRCLCKKCAPQ